VPPPQAQDAAHAITATSCPPTCLVSANHGPPQRSGPHSWTRSPSATGSPSSSTCPNATLQGRSTQRDGWVPGAVPRPGRGVVRARTRTTAWEPAVRTRAVGSVKPWSVARARASAVVAGRARSVARRSARTPRGRKPPASGSVKPTRPPGRSARSQSASAAAAQEVQRGGAQDQVEAVVGHRQRHGRCHPPVDRAGQAEPGRPRTACGDHAGRQVNGQDGHGGRLVVVRVVIAGGQLIELLRHPSVRPRRSHRRSIARTRCPTAASFGRAIRGESESTS